MRRSFSIPAALVASFAFLSSAIASPIVSIGTVTSETNNGGGGYTNASSIVPARVTLRSARPSLTRTTWQRMKQHPRQRDLPSSGQAFWWTARLRRIRVTAAMPASIPMKRRAGRMQRSIWGAELALGMRNSSSRARITSAVLRSSPGIKMAVPARTTICWSGSDGVNFYSLSNGTDHTIPNPTSSTPQQPEPGFPTALAAAHPRRRSRRRSAACLPLV